MSVEPIEIRTQDGWTLRADVYEPAPSKPRGVAVLAHAMMARRSEFERAENGGLARFLVERGWRTVVFDFRGHGESGPSVAAGGSWSYDDLVRHDLPAVVDCVRARARRLPVIVVGHSLGGHVALAAQGSGLLGVDAIVGFGVNVWLRSLEPSAAVWALKRGVCRTMEAACARFGYFPTRLLRLGSDDEAAPYVMALTRFARTDAWASDDGRVDYLATLANVNIPVLSIASDGDLLSCRPVCARGFIGRCGGPFTFERVLRADDGTFPPGHMELVTTRRAASVWARAEGWMRASVTNG